ncbi:MAG: DJ-1/PfpI family protein [Candidatus Babeliales bacterium]
MATNKILLVIASTGYQSIEYNVPKKLLETAGFIVETASNKLGVATASDNSTTHVDILLQHVSPEQYDAILFIGGPESLTHLDNETSYAVIQKAAELSLILGAICLATRIFAHADILDNKKATGWNGDNELGKIYQEHDIRYIPQQDIVTDGNIITASGPHVAREFGESIISMLQTKNNW